jgi:hypothetical protein
VTVAGLHAERELELQQRVVRGELAVQALGVVAALDRLRRRRAALPAGALEQGERPPLVAVAQQAATDAGGLSG